MGIVLVCVVAGCGRAPRGSGEPPTMRPVGADAGVVVVAPVDAAVMPKAIEECLGLDGRAVAMTLVASTPDCSGVGHSQVVFEIAEVAGGGRPLVRAHLECMLYGPCSQLGGADDRDGTFWIGVVREDPRPARTFMCVALPATDAKVSCARQVASLAEARRWLAAR